MLLYLVRHGEAKSEQEDPERHLTDTGRAEVERVAWYAAFRLKVRVQSIFDSGKVRARETSEIFAKYLSPPRGVLKVEGLDSGADPSYWVAKLSEYSEPIMLVGHLPHLAKLASALVTGIAAEEWVELPAASIVCLENRNGMWSLKWILTPQMT